MIDDEVRARLQSMFRAGFPRSLPRALRLPDADLESDDRITIDGGKGHPCSICGRIIEHSDSGSIAIRYDDRVARFHQRCHQLWDEERRKPLRRPAD
jgi:hypothetical protein